MKWKYARRSAGNQIDRLVCDERRCTTCLLCAEERAQINPLLRDLHWLRVPERIEFKLSVLVFRCLYGTALPYLASELRRVVDVDTRMRLRSSSTSALCHTICQPMTWNSLSADLRDPTCSDESFRGSLKTFLFAKY